MMSMERLNKTGIKQCKLHYITLCRHVYVSIITRTAAVLMYKYDAHAATDVTGFGILGHAQNLAKEQTDQVEFVIDSLPYIDKSYDLANCLKMKRYLEGVGAETSGIYIKHISRTGEKITFVFRKIRWITNCNAKNCCNTILF